MEIETKVWGAFLWGITHGILIVGIILRYYILKQRGLKSNKVKIIK